MATDFSTSILVNKTPAEVFDAIVNVGGWWQGEVTGSAKNLNDEFSYQMKEFHFSVQKVVEMIPDKRIVWLVTDSKLNFIEDKEEWTGTKIVFDISEQGNQTLLQFTHEGLVPEVECYADCSAGWTGLIQKSLFSYITAGKGVDVF